MASKTRTKQIAAQKTKLFFQKYQKQRNFYSGRRPPHFGRQRKK